MTPYLIIQQLTKKGNKNEQNNSGLPVANPIAESCIEITIDINRICFINKLLYFRDHHDLHVPDIWFLRIQWSAGAP